MKRETAIVFQDEQGYYILEEKESKRERVNVEAEEVFIERDEETGEYFPSDVGPPCLQCDETFANTFLDDYERKQLEKFERGVHALVVSGNVYIPGKTPEGENLYQLTGKGASRSSIETLTTLLKKADQASRDFTVTELHVIQACIYDLQSVIKKREEKA